MADWSTTTVYYAWIQSSNPSESISKRPIGWRISPRAFVLRCHAFVSGQESEEEPGYLGIPVFITSSLPLSLPADQGVCINSLQLPCVSRAPAIKLIAPPGWTWWGPFFDPPRLDTFFISAGETPLRVLVLLLCGFGAILGKMIMKHFAGVDDFFKRRKEVGCSFLCSEEGNSSHRHRGLCE